MASYPLETNIEALLKQVEVGFRPAFREELKKSLTQVRDELLKEFTEETDRIIAATADRIASNLEVSVQSMRNVMDGNISVALLIDRKQRDFKKDPLAK